MQKLTRTLAMAGALAFAGVLAGCGDDVTVAPNPSLDLSPPSATIPVGSSVTFSATVQGLSNKAVNWASDNTAKATVDANGKVTGVSAGTATITATAAGDATLKKSAVVTVTAVNKGVTKVDISPNTAILKQGEFLQLTANVTADPGVARTVTWSSSANTIATVDAAGKLTAVTNGTAIITAASTVDPTVTGTMSLTVRPTQPAQISIQKVTTVNTNTPVNFNNVFGQIDVTLNLDPGDQTVTKVEVLIDNKTACSQNLSVAESQQLALAAVNPEGVEAVDILCSINTADFNPTTGAVTYQNGPRQLTAKATIGGTQPGNVATPSQTLTFNNANSFVLTQALSGTTKQATSAAGLLYKRGSLDISVLPVIYNAGQTIAVATATFGSAACDANGTGARSRPLTAPAGGTGAWTTSFGVTTSATVAIGTTVKDYEYNNSPACLAQLTNGPSGEVATIVATDNAGNTIFTSAIPANIATAGIRLDNRAPGAPTFWANPNGRRNGWINATVGLNGANNASSATSNNWMQDGAADLGVGGYVRILRTADATGGLVDAAIAATGSATATLPAPSVANTSYCAVISAQDLLGNESALPAAGSACTAPPATTGALVSPVPQALEFGVDIAAPTIAYADPAVVPTALSNGARQGGASISGEFVVTVADTGAVGNSGMLAGSPVRATVIRREATGTDFATAPTDCVVGTLNAALTTCSQTATGLVVGLPLVSTAITALNVAGYYTYAATAFDAAGNSTALPATSVIVYDGTPATATNPSVPATITGAFSSASFLNDNLSIRDYYYTVGFGAAPAYLAPTTIRIAAAPTAVDAFNAATLSNTNVGINSTINTFLGLQSTTGGNAPNAYVGGSIPLNALNLFVRDQAQAAYTGPATAVVAPTAPAAGVSTTGFNTFVPATSNATICAGTLAAGCAAVPTSTVITAKANGVTATFNNPFSRVDFYAPLGGDLILIGSVPAASASLVDDGATRVWTYSLTLQAASLYTQLGGVSPAVVGPVNIYAFGVSPTGSVALVAQPVAQTINP